MADVPAPGGAIASAAATRRPVRLAILWRRFGLYALLLFVVLVWGGSFVAARALLAPPHGGTALTPTMLATVRFLLASAVFLPILAARQRAHPIRWRDVPTFLLLGQLGISLYFLMQYTGVRLTNAGIAAVTVIGLTPLATMVVSGVALREPIGGKRTLALLVGAAGVAIVVSQGGLRVDTGGDFLLGGLCLVGNAVMFAVYTTLIRGVRARYSPLTITAGMMLGGTLGLVLLALVTEDWRTLGTLSAGQWAAIAYLGLLCSVTAFFLYNYALSRIEASKAAVWIYLEPVVAVALGALLLGEAVTPQTVAGGAVILVSLILVQRW